jgi:hypothetical protein
MVCVIAVGLVALATAVRPVFAQSHAGVRAGASGDPDQFFFGGHIETSQLADHLTFRPNVELGVGNGLTLLALNFEFAYWIPLQRRHDWSPYVGAGPAANIYSRPCPAAVDYCSKGDLSGGLNFLLGVQHQRGLFAEFKVGAMDSPSVKFTVGYAFK